MHYQTSECRYILELMYAENVVKCGLSLMYLKVLPKYHF